MLSYRLIYFLSFLYPFLKPSIKNKQDTSPILVYCFINPALLNLSFLEVANRTLFSTALKKKKKKPSKSSQQINSHSFYSIENQGIYLL